MADAGAEATQAVEAQYARTIEWKPYLWSSSKPGVPSDIQAVEEKLNVKFPEDYKEVVLAHQGETPTPGIFRFYNPEQEAYDASPLQVLFHFVANAEEHAAYHILSVHETLQDRLPEGVVPIGEDPGGSYVAFDFRVLEKLESAKGPCVVFLDHEMEDDEGKFMTIFLADSFTGFLHQLKTEEEMDAELEVAELVGDEEDEEEEGEEEGEEGEGEGGEEEHDGEDDEDDEAVEHVAKRRRNEEGDEDVHDEADDDVDDEEDDEANVGDKRKKPTDD